MRSQNAQYTDVEDSNSFKELRLLQELEETPEISQRDLSRKLGIARVCGGASSQATWARLSRVLLKA
jgi:hypothetical protein